MDRQCKYLSRSGILRAAYRNSPTPEAAIQCDQVAEAGKYLHVWQNDTYVRHIGVPFMTQTYPMADIFWLCDDDKQVKTVLPKHWEGLCAPVMVTEQMTVLSAKPSTQNRTKREIRQAMEKDEKLYIAWNQEPVGEPDEHLAISEAWIKSGQAVGWIPMIGTIEYSQYIARNSR